MGYVTSDNVAGARLAVRHLYGLGHRRIATVTGPPQLPAGGDRLQGYRDEHAALGIVEREDDLREGDFYVESGYREGRALLAAPDGPTAVFAASDMMALGVIRAARELGLSVPGDVAVVGFDDAPLAERADPPLTTVRQDKLGIGAAAATALVGMIESEAAPPPALVLPVELVVRRSCGAQSGGTLAAPRRP